jgi:hypothetical protein
MFNEIQWTSSLAQSIAVSSLANFKYIALSTENSRPWEDISRQVIKEYPNILWGPKCYDRLHKIPLLVPNQGQNNPDNCTPSNFSKLYSNTFLP